jgi:hypothetical protein
MTAYQDEFGNIIMKGNDGNKREFMTDIIENGNDEEVLYQLYKETARVIMLVRDRLEREKPIETKLETIIEGEIVG